MGRRRGATHRTVAAGFLAGLAGALLLAGCGSTGVQTTHSAVPGLSAKPASFDDLEIDQAAHRLYAADRTDTGVDVFDISGPAAKFVKTITLPEAPNGLALAPDLSRLFAGTASGAVEVEPRMDVRHVAAAVVYMASLPLDANVQFMTVMATKMPFIGRG